MIGLSFGTVHILVRQALAAREVLFLQRQAEPEDRIIRSSLDDDATPSRDSLRAVISKPAADALILLMSADTAFLTPKPRFGKKTYPSHARRAQSRRGS